MVKPAMAPPDADAATDASPIKAVSSLRSKFETLGKGPTHLVAASSVASSSHAGRLSLDLPRPLQPPGSAAKALGPHRIDTQPYGHLRHNSTSSPKSSSMVDLPLAPRVTIDSPSSPPRRTSPQSPTLMSTEDAEEREQYPASDPRNPSRSSLSQLQTQAQPQSQTKPAGPPPINRAGKPNLLPKQPHPSVTDLQKTPPPEPSPFNTPPSSSEGTPVDTVPHSIFHSRTSNRPFKQEGSYFVPKPIDRSSKPSTGQKARSRAGSASTQSQFSDGFASPASQGLQISGLPAASTSTPTSSRPRMIPSRPSHESVPRSQVHSAHSSPPLPARPSADTQVSSTTPMLAPRRKFSPPAVPAPRRSVDIRRSVDYRYDTSANILTQGRDITPAQSRAVSVSTEANFTVSPATRVETINTYEEPTDSSSYPDASRSNRRPPRAKTKATEIATGYDTRLCAVAGEYVCTTGYLTRVWSTETGQYLTSLVHGENVRVTSLCWKPAKELIDADKRLWLGTGDGSLLEFDVAAGVVVHDRPHAHPRAQVIRMYRHASDMFTLDDDGRLLAWRPRDDHAPSLTDTPLTLRVAKGHSASIMTRDQLWIATGKDVRVYNLNARSDSEINLLSRPLSQECAGDITTAATLSDKHVEVYFGHVDGKVSIYNRNDFSCLGVINVSLYKISTLSGVGSYLWAGYTTGIISVYDTSSIPWRVVKDWKAHANPVAAIAVDQASIWETQLLPIVSLGTDNVLRVWDGMLRDDWLLHETQTNCHEYCEIEQICASILTWNAGATKPSSLRANSADANFFREYLSVAQPADILVFGFQELVDLEDKKLTAKSFFKSKKKDPSDQEHMSHQYRAWRDYLAKCVDDYMPATASYTLLHTASMIGLFSCVFVKSSLRTRIKHVSTGEVKRGIGGLHGNKGALLLRLVLDNSALCFVNCHLAAGQSQTSSRHNDVAAILDSEILPSCGSVENSAELVDAFVGGGDGTMIMDHETCILNGDLNYRIDAMTRDAIIRCVREKNLTKLLDRDQLLLSRKRNPAFKLRAFVEPPIAFAPTYKYNVGTDDYDTSEKKRSPAWCDRILHRGTKVACTEYRRWDDIRASDHRPVSGRFAIQVKRVDAKRREPVRRRAEEAFVRFKAKTMYNLKLDYLMNVYGLAHNEAATYLHAHP